jgi:hypothetical protein
MTVVLQSKRRRGAKFPAGLNLASTVFGFVQESAGMRLSEQRLDCPVG